MNPIRIGAKSVVCPLGSTPSEVYRAMHGGRSAIRHYDRPFGMGTDWPMGRIASADLPQESMDSTKLENMLAACYAHSLRKLAYDPFVDDSGLVIICTTKGNIDLIGEPDDPRLPLHRLAKFMQYSFGLSRQPLVLSNACISGLQGIISAARIIRSGRAEHVLVLGADLVSEFTLSGFGALHALDPAPCRPYDASRAGINLGEAAAGLVLSGDESLFKGRTVRYAGGAASNDANHISGPSRTGEGLFRAIQRAMGEAGAGTHEVGYVSAHGTGTLFNDEMEAIALERARLSHVPVNSLKGYLGHTLGAAGVIETLLGLESIKQGALLPSLGYSDHGVSRPMNVLREPQAFKGRYFLKTASGFGGGNAAALFEAD